MSNIAVLMTSHSRRDTTVACLKSLATSVGDVDGLAYTVYLTDDGSTDGTERAVSDLGLPLAIIQGTGDLFWNRGMVKSWSAAVGQRHQFDGFLLLNDDTTLDRRALPVLLETDRLYGANAVIVGATRDPVTGDLTYGGVVRTSSWHPGRTARLPISDKPQDADAFNANCVYVPRAVYEAVGMLDPTFQHGIGDFDYGYRVRERGMRVIVAPGTIGTCARNDVVGTWRDTSLPLKRRLALLQSPKGLPYAQWVAFLRRHGAPMPRVLALAPRFGVLRSGLWR